MHVSGIKVSDFDDSVELQACIRSPALKEPFLLWYRFPLALSDLIDPESGDPLVAALLLPAMKTGEAVDLPVPVSPRLAQSLKWIQAIFCAWDPTLSNIELHSPLRKEMAPPGAQVGLFFSAGVDSLYSLIKNSLEHPLNEAVVTDLLVIYGADIYLSDGKDGVFQTMLDKAQDIASHFRKRVIPIATNVKGLLSAYHIPRGFLGHGAALASVGLALQGLFSKIYISSGNTFTDLGPAGNHPLLDPLWSTEACTFVHDGLEASRLEKIRFIAQSDIALKTLRVCWNKDSRTFNCGRCSKCLRTMLGLYIAGALDRCNTLPHRIDPDLLRNIPLLHNYEDSAFFLEILEALGDSGADVQIRTALLEGLEKGRSYFARLGKAQEHIRRIIPFNVPFILVDRDSIRSELGIGRAIVPFLELDGQYNGPPADDTTAIGELERLVQAGAKFIVFWWSEFWWLGYYTEFQRRLRSKYRCLVEDESAVIFDLHSTAG